jgi:hypothetical protein
VRLESCPGRDRPRARTSARQARDLGDARILDGAAAHAVARGVGDPVGGWDAVAQFDQPGNGTTRGRGDRQTHARARRIAATMWRYACGGDIWTVGRAGREVLEPLAGLAAQS